MPKFRHPSHIKKYLFQCIIQINNGGDETTFAFAVTHHQNLSQGLISTVIYVNFVLVLALWPDSNGVPGKLHIPHGLDPSSGPCPGDGRARQLQRPGRPHAGNGRARRRQSRGRPGAYNKGAPRKQRKRRCLGKGNCGGGDSGDGDSVNGDDNDDDNGSSGSDNNDEGGDDKDNNISDDDHNGGNGGDGGGGCNTATAVGIDTDKSTIN